MRSGHPVTLRAFHTTCLDSFEPQPETIIFMGSSVAESPRDWSINRSFICSERDVPPWLRYGIERVVLNITYTWPDQLFASPNDFESDDGFEWEFIQPLFANSPIPTLGENEAIEVVDMPCPAGLTLQQH